MDLVMMATPGIVAARSGEIHWAAACSLLEGGHRCAGQGHRVAGKAGGGWCS